MADEPNQQPPQRQVTLHTARSQREVMQSAFHPRGGLPLFGSMKARRDEGEQPVVVPRIILQAPLWCPSKGARQTPSMRFEWFQPDREQAGSLVKWVVETLNPLEHNTGEAAMREGDPFGRLQWFDLDLLMCLTLEFFNRNCRTTYITLDQTSILQWIGYRQVHDPPYAKLRAAIKRMSWTQVAYYRSGDKEHATGIELLNKSSTWDRGTRRRPGAIVALLAESWLEQIYNEDGDRQIIDLTRYFHLVRHIRQHTGAPDLTRSVFTFLSSFADRDLQTTVKTDWLIERFAPRSVRMHFDQKTQRMNEIVHLRSADPLRKGQLADALRVLTASSVVQDISIEGDRLKVKWTPARTIAKLPHFPEQKKLFDKDLASGNILVIDHEGLPDLAGLPLAKAVDALRARILFSVQIESQMRARGWGHAQLASAYGIAVVQVTSGVIADAGAFVATAAEEDPHAWWPNAVKSRDKGLYDKVFGPEGLLRHQAGDLEQIVQGPEIISAAQSSLPSDQLPSPDRPLKSSTERVLEKLRTLVRVDRQVEDEAITAGWTPAHIANLYLVTVYKNGKLKDVHAPAAWAAAILRANDFTAWTKQGFRQQGFDFNEIWTWATGEDGPMPEFGVGQSQRAKAKVKAPEARRVADVDSRATAEPSAVARQGREASAMPAEQDLDKFVVLLRECISTLKQALAEAIPKEDDPQAVKTIRKTREFEMKLVQKTSVVLGAVLSDQATVEDLIVASLDMISSSFLKQTRDAGAAVLAHFNRKKQ